ncbi:hypothetical protein [Methylobacterium crusticola]|uniref:hypothetical protein n=1 Tax=Methylobacterium crusticola TaxID=1697972 RepID=UPI001FD2A768|nr:hypothetical protein [Methylobacterium crusticola]
MHVSEVHPGLACGCRCPGCKAPLVARKGDRRDHHFGHHGVAEQPACRAGAETALHIFAKECLARRLELVLPSLEHPTTYQGGPIRFDAAALEHRLGDIVPDVVVRKGGRDLLVEFRVTHPCDATKIARIADLGIAAVEIDLSWLPRDLSRVGLAEAILTQAPRKWLHNPRLRGPTPGQLEPPRSSEPGLGRAASLARIYAAACAELRVPRAASLPANRISADGLTRAIGIDVPGLGCFTVPPRDWQAAVLEQALDQALLGTRWVITAAEALRQLRQRGVVRSRFTRLSSVEVEALKMREPSFAPPADAISAWAGALAHLGILVPAGGRERWTLWPDVLQVVRAARRARASA